MLATIKHIVHALLKLTRQYPPLARWLTKVLVNLKCYATAPRPRPFSMAADYTTWTGLTNRHYTGRHLLVADRSYMDALPPEDKVVDLFKRNPTEQKVSTDTSVLFMFFAQWFTDSFLRTDPNDIRLNTSNHEIDLCQIYGLTEEKTNMLRTMQRGFLQSQEIEGEEYPPYLFEEKEGKLVIKEEFQTLHDKRLQDGTLLLDIILEDVPPEKKKFVFAVGLEHGNATIGYTLLNTIFLREHNRIARKLAEHHPAWDDERLFQTTRNIMIVLILKLVIEEYIKHIAPYDVPIKLMLGLADGERWCRTNWISIEFNILYRWHSLVPNSVTLKGAEVRSDILLNNNELVFKNGICNLIADLSTSKANKIGLFNTPPFLTERMRDPNKPSIEERTVSMTREARMRSYNDYREQFGLSRLQNFEQLTSDRTVKDALKELYNNNIDNLEWYPGIFAEGYDDTEMMGELLGIMVAYDAFTQALTNPLLSKNIYNEATFSKEGLQIIDTTACFEDIVKRNVSNPSQVHASFSTTK
jgi:prostaglandin-endoperoxide synthase 2